jgi:uncharacterized protein (DUF58 family)
VEGPPAAPIVSIGVARGTDAVRIPVDTTTRGERPIGPFVAVYGDPWSVVRRVAGRSVRGTVLVRPRVLPVRRGFAASQSSGANEAASRRRGDDQFFALRDYVLGDEPRNVHWRSSARSGRLVVKQKVADASEGTLIVLDVDASAYGSGSAFAGGFVDERFEVAVEVAASLCAARTTGVQRVQFVTTARNARVATAGASGAPNALLDALAVVQAIAPVDAAPELLASVVRRTRCSTVLIVTGTPTSGLVAGVRGASASTVVVRVGDAVQGPLAGVRVMDVAAAEDLA